MFLILIILIVNLYCLCKCGVLERIRICIVPTPGGRRESLALRDVEPGHDNTEEAEPDRT